MTGAQPSTTWRRYQVPWQIRHDRRIRSPGRWIADIGGAMPPVVDETRLGVPGSSSPLAGQPSVGCAAPPRAPYSSALRRAALLITHEVMPVRDALPAVLRGEVGADLSPPARTELET